jgi:hypothetical protein
MEGQGDDYATRKAYLSAEKGPLDFQKEAPLGNGLGGLSDGNRGAFIVHYNVDISGLVNSANLDGPGLVANGD